MLSVSLVVAMWQCIRGLVHDVASSRGGCMKMFHLHDHKCRNAVVQGKDWTFY